MVPDLSGSDPKRDPVYREIIERLGSMLDGQLFERVVVDLLRAELPGLVPVLGGNDAGMDGAFSSEDESRCPLICTTQDDVIGNLTKSLDSILKSGHKPRKVALATSRSLTTRQERNLLDRAAEKGFDDVQIFNREAIADRLGGRPDLFKELGITGQPPALSEIPLGDRTDGTTPPLIGRDGDVEWLRSTSGDRLVVGPPGAGKTYLLKTLVGQGWGRFLVHDDPTAIANSLRSLKPEVVVVDDAHVNLDWLQEIRRLRDDLGESFDIVATTWDYARGTVLEALGSLPSAQVRRLELLTRKEIAQLFRALGVEADESVLSELVLQAANKPGLAATLANLWLRGDWKSVITAQSLTELATASLDHHMGDKKSAFCLACFAVGGNHGMPRRAVADFLRCSSDTLDGLVTALASGGVLAESGRGALAVWPRALRAGLLRLKFFSGAGQYDEWHALLEHARSASDAVDTVIRAVLYGAEVDGEFLRDLVKQHAGANTWGMMAATRQHAEWALENCPPGSLVGVAYRALSHAADRAIPCLLRCAEGDNRERQQNPDHPLRTLQEWAQDVVRVNVDTMLVRRKQLARHAREYLVSGGAPGVAMDAIGFVLDPRVRGSESAAAGDAVILTHGLVPPNVMVELAEVWESCRDLVASNVTVAWRRLHDALWAWAHPSYASGGQDVPDDIQRTMKQMAVRMLRDLQPALTQSPGLAADLARWGVRLDEDFSVSVDPEFSALFPADPPDHDSDDLESTKSSESLAHDWSAQGARHVAARIAYHETEAETIGQTWPRRTPELAHVLAARVADPLDWLRNFIDADLRADVVGPFLGRVSEERPEGWEAALESSLVDPRYRGASLGVLLRLENPPASLEAATLAACPEWLQLVNTWCLRDEIPESTLEALLNHDDPLVALAAAVGTLRAGSDERSRGIREACRHAVLRAPSVEQGRDTRSRPLFHWLGEVLERDPELANDWVQARIEDRDLPHWVDPRGPLCRALGVLDTDQRCGLLESAASRLEAGTARHRVVAEIVGQDPAVYATLLELSALGDCRLTPFDLPLGPKFVDLARLALDAGCSPEEIAARTALQSGVVISGQDDWNEQRECFTALLDSDHAGLRELGEHGLRHIDSTVQLYRERDPRE